MKSRIVVASMVIAVLAAFPVLAKKKDKEEKAAETPKATSSTAGTDVVATVAGESITAAELEKAAAAQLMRIRQQEFEIRQGTLDSLIQKKLLDKEAAARNVSLADLLKAEVEDKSVAPTADEINNFYEQNKGRIGNRTKEDVLPDIEKNLRAQKQATRRNQFLTELRTKSDVRVLLEPPRVAVPIPPDAPVRGNASGPITLVEFSDFQCPFCKRAEPTVEQLLKDYDGKIKFVYRDYPLSFHPRAFPASQAAHCAGAQGKYWDYHTNLMNVNGDLSADDFKKRATDLGLDVAAFTTCLDSKQFDGQIQASFDDGASVGVTGTPAFFINGRMVVGAQPIEAFKQVIDQELARLDSGKAAATTTK